MKSNILAIVLAAVMFTSCGYAGVGAAFGGSLGSAIGGLTGGFRGHHLGSLIGMAGGAAIGAAVEASQQRAQERQYEDDMYKYREEKARLAANRASRQRATTNDGTYPTRDNKQDEVYDSGFDSTNSGDDRIDLDMSNNDRGDYGNFDISTVAPIDPTTPGQAVLEIRNARFIDGDKDGIIGRNESSSLVFEVMNTGSAPAYAVQPTVLEVSGNKHIHVSPSILVERIDPGKGVRYTARVVSDNSLKKGTAQFNVSVNQGNKTLTKVLEFSVPTVKK